MNLQRKLTLIAATGAVALSAGHFVQKQANNRVADGNLPSDVVISAVTPVAAGPEALSSPTSSFMPPIMDASVAPNGTDVSTSAPAAATDIARSESSAPDASQPTAPMPLVQITPRQLCPLCRPQIQQVMTQ